MGPRAVPLPVFEAARRGDRSAIVLLLEITKPDIHRFARKSCRTSADAEEATQEAMWALFRRIVPIRLAFHGRAPRMPEAGATRKPVTPCAYR